MDTIDNGGKKSRPESGLAGTGVRPTRQRSLVYEVVKAKTDHPTAETIFARAREKMPTISLATVYNCLETLVDCGLVRAVHRDRLPTRYCANACEHAHFHDRSGAVTDVALPAEALKYLRSLVPQGYVAESVELNFIGRRKDADGAAFGGENTNLSNPDEPRNT